MNRQRLILFVLVILFVIVALWSYSATPKSKKVGALTYKPGQQAKMERSVPVKLESTPDDGTRLKIALLEKEPGGFKGFRRNIFKPFITDDLKVAKPKPEVIRQPPPKAYSPVEPVIKKPEIPPLARFTFLGFLKKGAVKIIFLTSEKDILLVKKGDKIVGRYEATDISDNALTLTVSDTGDKIVIPLVENRTLVSIK